MEQASLLNGFDKSPNKLNNLSDNLIKFLKLEILPYVNAVPNRDKGFEQGNKLRKCIDVVYKDFKDRPNDVKRYLNFNVQQNFKPNLEKIDIIEHKELILLMQGLMSTLYYKITGDSTPILEKKYGGLGATIKSGLDRLVIKEHQLMFSLFKGFSLEETKFIGESAKYSVSTDFSCLGSEKEGKSFEHSLTEDHSHTNSSATNEAFHDSKHTGWSVGEIKISGNAFVRSDFLDYSFGSFNAIEEAVQYCRFFNAAGHGIGKKIKVPKSDEELKKLGLNDEQIMKVKNILKYDLKYFSARTLIKDNYSEAFGNTLYQCELHDHALEFVHLHGPYVLKECIKHSSDVFNYRYGQSSFNTLRYDREAEKNVKAFMKSPVMNYQSIKKRTDQGIMTDMEGDLKPVNNLRKN
jgi:hypothetical protein